MKLALAWLFILHLALVSAGIFTRNDNQAARISLSDSRAQVPQRAGSVNPGRQRPLFARRGQYERQRVHKPKHNAVSVPPNDLSLPCKEAHKPVKSNCSQLTQSCVPQSGCCDPSASCHCRFFNTICFCRRTNSKKKT